MEIDKIGVVGCGQMGRGIAQAVAAAGYTVMLAAADPARLEQGMISLRAQVAHEVAHGRLTEGGSDAILGRVHGVAALDELADCDLVVESIVEDLDKKRSLFAALDSAVKPEAILASNTSSLSIAALAAATTRPARVAGCHFFNPAPRIPLIELVRALGTSEETVETLRAVAARLGKTAVLAQDTPGFIVASLLIPYLLDAVRALEHGVAARDDLDAAMTLGCHLPMGPLTLADFIGTDTVLYVADAMYAETRDPRHAAPPLLRRLVAAGLLGRKSGKGFYTYG